MSVNRPVDVVVLDCCVTETRDTVLPSDTSTILAKSERAGLAVDLVDHHGIDRFGGYVSQQLLQRRPLHRTAGDNALIMAVAHKFPAKLDLRCNEGRAGFALCV